MALRKLTFFHGENPVKHNGVFKRQPVTVATVILDNGYQLFGTAKMHPDDQSNRIMARKVAVTNAISTLSRAERKEIWKEIWERGMRKP